MDSSKYQDKLNKLLARKCPTCHGSGEVNDAAPGDMSFKVFWCPECGGTGMTKKKKGVQQ